MTKHEVVRAMAAAGIQGRVPGYGENWEVELPDDASKDRFLAEVAAVGATRSPTGGWILRPMKQAGLPFGTLDAAEQVSLFK